MHPKRRVLKTWARPERFHLRSRPGGGIIAGMKYLIALLALTVASCAQSPRPGNESTRAPDTGGGAIEGSENRSDASRTRSRT